METCEDIMEQRNRKPPGCCVYLNGNKVHFSIKPLHARTGSAAANGCARRKPQKFAAALTGKKWAESENHSATETGETRHYARRFGADTVSPHALKL